MASDCRPKNYERSLLVEKLVADARWQQEPRPVVRAGDTLTIDGIYPLVPNPAWRWWAFWRPRYVMSSALQTFRVIDCAPGDRP